MFLLAMLLFKEFVNGENGRRELELELIFFGVDLFLPLMDGEKRGGRSNLPDFNCFDRLPREVM
eukprot:scaffold10689_cov195-Chaetoceros_neogracile.AAC.1